MKNLPKIVLILVVLALAGVAVGLAAEFLSNNKSLKTAEQNQNPDQDVVLAKVGSQEITLKDINANFNFDAQQLQGVDPQQIYNVLLQQVVGQRLLDQAAKKEISNSNKSLREEMDKARTQIKRNLYLEEMFAKELTEKDMVMAYQQYVAQIPESNEKQIHARHILVKDKAEAESIINELNAGKDFVSLAQQHSKDPAAQSGGDLGFFSKGQMVKEFADAAFKLDVGQYTKAPVKTQFGWHVILVEGKRVEPKPTFEDVRGELENSLRQQVLDKHLGELTDKYGVKRFDPKTGEEIVQQDPEMAADSDAVIDPAIPTSPAE
jgi:peptidyl-prolyl cis-trans isomerase C